jgi:uncharacterized protein
MPIRTRRISTFAVMLAASLAATAASVAQEAKEPVPRVTVMGEGVAKAAPDMAILTLSVIREANTAGEAVTANNAAMADVVAAMKDAGIAEADLQTANFSVQPRYIYPTADANPGDPKIVGYTAQNTLTVRIRSLADTGVILDRAVGLGVNSTSGLILTNDDPSAFLTQARTKAVQDAVGRAKTLAEAAGVTVGRILDMSEQSFIPQPIPMAAGKMAMAAEAADAVPIQSGENEYRVTVNVVFELK